MKKENKIKFYEIQDRASKHIFQPHTVFINEKGIFDLVKRSTMPTDKKRNIEEIYVATNKRYKNENIYKIGRSKDSVTRVKSMNTCVIPADDLYLCYVSQCYNSFLVEKIIHNLLEDYRIAINREFFKLSFEEIKITVDEICEYFK